MKEPVVLVRIQKLGRKSFCTAQVLIESIVLLTPDKSSGATIQKINLIVSQDKQ